MVPAGEYPIMIKQTDQCYQICIATIFLYQHIVFCSSSFIPMQFPWLMQIIIMFDTQNIKISGLIKRNCVDS